MHEKELLWKSYLIILRILVSAGTETFKISAKPLARRRTNSKNKIDVQISSHTNKINNDECSWWNVYCTTKLSTRWNWKRLPEKLNSKLKLKFCLEVGDKKKTIKTKKIKQEKTYILPVCTWLSGSNITGTGFSFGQDQNSPPSDDWYSFTIKYIQEKNAKNLGRSKLFEKFIGIKKILV